MVALSERGVLMNWPVYILNVISLFFEAYTLLLLFGSIEKEQKTETGKRLLGGIVFIVILAVVYLFTDNTYIKIGAISIATIIYSLWYEIPALKRLFYSLLIVLFSILCEFAVGFAISGILDETVNAVRDSILYYAIGVFSSKLLVLFGVKIFTIICFPKNGTMPLKIGLIFFIFPVATFLFGCVMLSSVGSEISASYAWIGVAATLSLAFANVIVLCLFDGYIKETEEKKELEAERVHMQTEQAYMKELIDRQTEAGKTMHDLKNELFVLRSELDTNSEKAISRIDEICKIVTAKQNMIYTGDVAIDSLINSKIAGAKAEQINFKCECHFSGFGDIDKTDLCVLVGNLIDNAVEACARVSGERYIHMRFSETANMLKIEVGNSTNDISASDLKTTKSDKDNHGYGIKSIKAIAQKYEGTAQFKNEKGSFTAIIFLNKIAC